ncbi:MAG: DUF4876 domain-containing protein [Bacteroidales bacterium]|nr:DUF4876 domain-containing protein [Bacteroidales bacterium]
MKRLLLFISVALAATMALSSCNDDKKEITSIDELTVTVYMPSDFPASAKFAGNVTLADRNNTSVRIRGKAIDGSVVLKNVPFGVYDVYADWELTADEFAVIAPDLAAGNTVGASLSGVSKIVTLAEVADGESVISLSLEWSVPSSLLFSKIYNFGTLNNAGKAYNIDKFVEIFNNTAEVQYVDGLCIGEAYGSAPVAGSLPGLADADVVYIQRVSRFPGSGTDYPVEPGKSIVVAMNAKNHIDAEVVTNTVDLSGADFEAYDVAGAVSFFPADNSDVPNLITDVYAASSSIAKLFVSQGNIPVLFKATDDEIAGFQTLTDPAYAAYPQYAPTLLCLPAEKVIDAVDQMRTGFESRGGKHVPTSVDAGYAMTNQKAVMVRKINYVAADGRLVFKDTNNSTNDFVQLTAEDGSHLKIRDYSMSEIQPK